MNNEKQRVHDAVASDYYGQLMDSELRRIIDLPPGWLPTAPELPGDLRRIAETLEHYLPGQGARLTLLIAQVFPGQSIYLRNPRKWLIARRDAAMKDAYDEGRLGVKELAARTGLSTRMVEKILAKP